MFGRRAHVTILILLLTLSIRSHAKEKQGLPDKQGGFALRTSVMSSAGVAGSSPTYRTDGSLGQSTPIGTGSDGDTWLFAGFWADRMRMMWVTEVPLPELPIDRLYPNQPNPFNPATTIPFSLAAASWVRIAVYTVRGELIVTLVDEHRKPGRYRTIWRGRDSRGRSVPSGVYLCTFQVDGYSSASKMLLLK